MALPRYSDSRQGWGSGLAQEEWCLPTGSSLHEGVCIHFGTGNIFSTQQGHSQASLWIQFQHTHKTKGMSCSRPQSWLLQSLAPKGWNFHSHSKRERERVHKKCVWPAPSTGILTVVISGMFNPALKGFRGSSSSFKYTKQVASNCCFLTDGPATIWPAAKRGGWVVHVCECVYLFQQYTTLPCWPGSWRVAQSTSSICARSTLFAKQSSPF